MRYGTIAYNGYSSLYRGSLVVRIKMRAESSGVALVTTAWLAQPWEKSRHVSVLNSFVLYHLGIGVAKILLFLDGPDADKAETDSSQVQPSVRMLHERVQQVVAQGVVELIYADKNQRDAGDVPTRQMVNASKAMSVCVAHNERLAKDDQAHELRWLLHLDMDELLYIESFRVEDAPHTLCCKLRQYVASLETQQIEQFTLVNYEAVPTSVHVGNYFASTTRFRVHPARIPLGNRETSAALAFWQSRSPFRQFFLFYDNGKSMVRVSRENASSGPSSVHHWRLQGESRSNFYDPRRSVAVYIEPDRGCILHYPVCGLEWLMDKYARLGDFAATWGSGTKKLAIQPCFHTQARDITVNSREDKESKMRELFESQVMLQIANDEWPRQLRSQVCQEICFPSELLAMERDLWMPQAYAASTSASTSDRAKQETTAAEEAKQGFTPSTAWLLASISQMYLETQSQ